MHPSQQFQRFSFKRMAGTNDGYLRGITVEMTVVVVGSLSSGLSTTLTTSFYFGPSANM
jgi:hypothetical protein